LINLFPDFGEECRNCSIGRGRQVHHVAGANLAYQLKFRILGSLRLFLLDYFHGGRRFPQDYEVSGTQSGDDHRT
jgi:hypothetical protein